MENDWGYYAARGVDTIDAGYIIRSNPEAAAEASQIAREFLEERL
jgi:hypothetical protein